MKTIIFRMIFIFIFVGLGFLLKYINGFENAVIILLSAIWASIPLDQEKKKFNQ